MCMKNSDLEAKLARYDELKAEKDRIEYELEEIKSTVLREMATRKKNAIQVGQYLAKRVDSVQGRVDSKALKAAEPETYAKYLKESPRVTFTVKVVPIVEGADAKKK